jgi:hypothetical protein
MNHVLAIQASLQKPIPDPLQQFGSTWHRPRPKEHACLNINYHKSFGHYWPLNPHQPIANWWQNDEVLASQETRVNHRGEAWRKSASPTPTG